MTAGALAAGYADFARLLAESVPGAALHEESGLVWVDSGLLDGTFNYVHGNSLSVDELERGVRRVVEHFQERELPFHWTVGLLGEPQGLAKILEAHGLRLDEQEPGMLLDPGESPAATPVPGLAIRPVTDAELLRQWVWAWGCGAPEDVIERWYGVYRALPYGPDGPLRMFVGFLDGEPVATVYLHITTGRDDVFDTGASDVGTVHYVVTRPEFRRRGIGAVMTQVAMREAEAAGCRAVVLTASPHGVGVYRRLGFREHCQADTYVWWPEAGPREVSA
jgi:ribosomal protein S18 acetylase RimI-like enzyme